MIHRLSFDSHGACARSSQSFQASSGLITSQTLELEARNKRILFAQPQIQEQMVDVPVLRFMEEIVEIVAGELVCNFWAGGSTGGRAHVYRGGSTAEQIVDVPQILEQNVEVIKVIRRSSVSECVFFF